MSFIHLLFPPGELEVLGNTWHEPAPKRRKVHSEMARVERRVSAPLPKQGYEARGHQRRDLEFSEQVAGWRAKRSYLETQGRAPRRISPAINKLSLLNFVEPSVLKNYFGHLLANGGHRYSAPPTRRSEAHSQGSTPHKSRDPAGSPGSLSFDSESPSSPADSLPTPATPASICDQFRSGPFGLIFDGLRLTDQERDLVEELVNPSASMEASELPSQKRKAPTDDEIIETLSQRTFLDLCNPLFHRIESTNPQTTDHRCPLVADPARDGGERKDKEKGKSSQEKKCSSRTTPQSSIPTISEKWCQIEETVVSGSEK